MTGVFTTAFDGLRHCIKSSVKTGLILKNLTAGHVTLRNVALYLLASAAAGIIIRSPELYFIIAFALGGSTVGAFAFGLNGPVEEQEAIMPVTPMQIELARYISYMVTYAVWLCLLAAFTLTSYLSGVIPAYDETIAATILNGFVGWSAMAFILGTLMFPFLRIMANTSISARTIFAICIFVVFLLSGFISSLLLVVMSPDVHIQQAIVGGLFVLYCISFGISLNVYKYKREKGVI